MADFVSLMKRAAAEAVEAQKPADIRIGTVTESAPLEIMLEQRLRLGKGQLLLPEHMTDHGLEIEAELMTGAAGGDAHAHTLSGRMQLRVLNGLKKGDRVILLRVPGGQKYIVLDRVME